MTEATTTRREYRNLFFLSNFDRDDHAVAAEMSGYNARDYADVDFTDPVALLREAQIEYDHVWRHSEDVYDTYEEAEVAAGGLRGRHVAEVSLELLASQIAHLAFQGRHADVDDSDVLEAERLDHRDLIRRVRALVEEQGLR